MSVVGFVLVALSQVALWSVMGGNWVRVVVFGSMRGGCLIGCVPLGRTACIAVVPSNRGVLPPCEQRYLREMAAYIAISDNGVALGLVVVTGIGWNVVMPVD